MAKLHNLQKLGLSANQINVLPIEISYLENLEVLGLNANQLSIFPLEIAQLINLQYLHLDENKLTMWPAEVAQLQNIKKLSLINNQLEEWPVEMALIKNLQKLYLMNNKLRVWPVEMAQLKNLQKLYLTGNELTTWPVEMTSLGIETYWGWKNKNGIFLGDNPFKNPPPEIIKQGNAAIIEYFKAGQQQKPLNEVRVLLVGDGGAGKTSLVKRLSEKEFDPHESQTKGININEWEVVDVTHCDVETGQEMIKTHLWDFGGQEIMHATHQFFLSKRSLYILVLDGRKDEKTEYWLKYIESFGGDSPILIVLNKIDQNPAFRLNESFLQEKYPSIQDFHRLSCETGEGVDEFRTVFQHALCEVEIRQANWPHTWFYVKTKLENLEEPHIDYKHYTQICQNANVDTPKAQETLLNFLCDLGIMFYFQEHILDNTHVLEPKWVTKAVYKIINSRQVADTQGILYLNELEDILQPTESDDYDYQRPHHVYIVGQMKKFELCYELNPQSVLIPDLLPVQRPDFDFDTEQALKFRIDYRFLPRSVMPRFIVNMHQDIQDDLCWRTGVILKDNEFKAAALVIADNEDRHISIAVTGEQRRDYFAIIRKTLNTIHNSFEIEKLGIDERVCLPDDPKLDVSLQHLHKLESMGESNYIPEGANKPYSVRALLGTVDTKFEQMIQQLQGEKKEDFSFNTSVSLGLFGPSFSFSLPTWKKISQYLRNKFKGKKDNEEK